METEHIDKLFLELSQFTKATTKREADLTTRLAAAEAAQRTDRISLVAWVLRNMDRFGCFSGDCPHDLNSECIESIVKQYEEDEAANGGRE